MRAHWQAVLQDTGWRILCFLATQFPACLVESLSLMTLRVLQYQTNFHFHWWKSVWMQGSWSLTASGTMPKLLSQLADWRRMSWSWNGPVRSCWRRTWRSKKMRSLCIAEWLSPNLPLGLLQGISNLGTFHDFLYITQGWWNAFIPSLHSSSCIICFAAPWAAFTWLSTQCNIYQKYPKDSKSHPKSIDFQQREPSSGTSSAVAPLALCASSSTICGRRARCLHSKHSDSAGAWMGHEGRSEAEAEVDQPAGVWCLFRELTVLGKSLDKGLDKPLDKPLGKRPKAGVTWSCSGPFLVPVVSILFKFNHVFHVFHLWFNMCSFWIISQVGHLGGWMWLDLVQGISILSGYHRRGPTASAGASFQMLISKTFSSNVESQYPEIKIIENEGTPSKAIGSHLIYFVPIGSYPCWPSIMWPILTGCKLPRIGRWQRSSCDDRGACGRTMFCSSGCSMLQWISIKWPPWLVGFGVQSKQAPIPFFLAMMQATGASRPSALRRRDGNVAQAMNKCTFEFRQILTIKSF